nr:reverse transcriptase domain-containing protein [Tanacetum cinerariifolium]
MNCKPHPFNGTEGVVGLKHWFEKIEQVLEICKCAEDDKVKFVVYTFEGQQRESYDDNRVLPSHKNLEDGIGIMDPYLERNKGPKRMNQSNEGAYARAYVMGAENPHPNPHVITGTFLLNDHYASILFDSGAERSYVSTVFTPFIDIALAALDTSYEVELANGKLVSTKTLLRGCTLALFNHVFKIDLLPTRLGSFDVIVRMDWLSYHCVVIVCYEKIVRISLLNGKILEIQGERLEKDPKSLSCIKADEKKLEDIPIVRDFPEIFLDDLSGLPLVREIEFRIDMIPGALPVVKSPYRLAPSKMLELSN